MWSRRSGGGGLEAKADVLVVGRRRGEVFCSGADLKYIRDQGDPSDWAYLHPPAAAPEQGFGESFKQVLEYLHSTISEIKRAPKPFIAAVDGVAAAGGFGSAMTCDLVFASERASFEWAYHKTGLTGAESSTFFLPRLIGLRKALELVLLNPRLDAVQARHMGLITDVFPTESFKARVLGDRAPTCCGPDTRVCGRKQLIHQAAGVDQLDYHLDEELRHLARIADSQDFAEGLKGVFREARSRVQRRIDDSRSERRVAAPRSTSALLDSAVRAHPLPSTRVWYPQPSEALCHRA